MARLAPYGCGGLFGLAGAGDGTGEVVDASGELVDVLPGSCGKSSEDGPRSLIKWTKGLSNFIPREGLTIRNLAIEQFSYGFGWWKSVNVTAKKSCCTIFEVGLSLAYPEERLLTHIASTVTTSANVDRDIGHDRPLPPHRGNTRLETA